MKKISTLVLFLLIGFVAVQAQTKFPKVDKSPMDIVYYPDAFPHLKIQNKLTEPLIARVIFSRPQKNGRTIFGELLEYGKVWRLGANEATEIEFFQNVKIGNTKIKKGRYTIYSVPDIEKWTMILNKETDIWGAFKYDQTKDVVRIDVAVQKQTVILETLAMTFEKNSTGADLVIGWDNFKVALPIAF